MKGLSSSGVRRMIVGLALVGAAAFGAAQALGASEPITASNSCCSYGKASFTIDEGAVATFQNDDPGIQPHDVTAVDNGRNGKPLFSSAMINLGQAPVNGTGALAPGTYRFFCTVHPTQMAAQLVVVGSGLSPTVKVVSRKLGKVVSKRKLQVKLQAVAVTNGISLTARKGSRKLGSASDINLAAGASRTVSVPLSRAGRNALQKSKAAKVKVTATAPGTNPASAAQRLH
jgi:plastocyanin